MMKNWSTKSKIELCVLLAIEFIVCLTPLGSIPIGPIVATISMVPVIITTLVLGLGAGLFMGFAFGLLSFIVWTFMTPNPAMAFLFTPFYSAGQFQGNFFSLVICFLPRILIPIFTYCAYMIFKNRLNDKIAMIIASVCGSLTNTIFVLFFIALFFGAQYEMLIGNSITNIIMATIFINGIPEAIFSAIVCPVISVILNKI